LLQVDQARDSVVAPQPDEHTAALTTIRRVAEGAHDFATRNDFPNQRIQWSGVARLAARIETNGKAAPTHRATALLIGQAANLRSGAAIEVVRTHVPEELPMH
jgi:hypothetical protein